MEVTDYNLVYNSLSFAIATFGAGTVFFFAQRSQVAPASATASPKMNRMPIGLPLLKIAALTETNPSSAFLPARGFRASSISSLVPQSRSLAASPRASGQSLIASYLVWQTRFC